MGRYYDGDINGKFWFGVQSSNAADRFGQKGYEPSYIEYYYDNDDLDEVEAEIKRIEDELGDKLETIDKFFSERFSYSDEDLKAIGIDGHDISEYADLGLGRKIRDCIKENGSCSFTAEL
jgi:hypothetical protein